MNYTNIYNLPAYAVAWLSHDDYDHNPDPNTISATSLWRPFQQRILSREYPEKLKVDVSSKLASRFGTAVHDSFEALKLGVRHEERLSAKLDNWTISGKFDLLLETGVIVDFKTTSVYKVIKADYSEYVRQLSIYRYLMARNGIEAIAGEICFMFTDWSSAQAKRGGDYPQSKMFIQRLELMPCNQTEAMIQARLREIEQAETEFLAGTLRRCTDDELWKDSDKYAVKKIGTIRAKKLYVSLDDAQAALLPGEEIESRIGKAKRCNYCDCCNVCNQYKELSTKGLIA